MDVPKSIKTNKSVCILWMHNFSWNISLPDTLTTKPTVYHLEKIKHKVFPELLNPYITVEEYLFSGVTA